MLGANMTASKPASKATSSSHWLAGWLAAHVSRWAPSARLKVSRSRPRVRTNTNKWPAFRAVLCCVALRCVHWPPSLANSFAQPYKVWTGEFASTRDSYTQRARRKFAGIICINLRLINPNQMKLAKRAKQAPAGEKDDQPLHCGRYLHTIRAGRMSQLELQIDLCAGSFLFKQLASGPAKSLPLPAASTASTASTASSSSHPLELAVSLAMSTPDVDHSASVGLSTMASHQQLNCFPTLTLTLTLSFSLSLSLSPPLPLGWHANASLSTSFRR